MLPSMSRVTGRVFSGAELVALVAPPDFWCSTHTYSCEPPWRHVARVLDVRSGRDAPNLFSETLRIKSAVLYASEAKTNRFKEKKTHGLRIYTVQQHICINANGVPATSHPTVRVAVVGWTNSVPTIGVAVVGLTNRVPVGFF